jgi:uncharacterized damage-inducible protein DinB
MTDLPWKKLTESCGASFDCIRNIFVHSLQSEQFWIRRLSGKSTEGIYSTPFSKFANLKMVQEYANKVEEEIKKFLETLTKEKLNDKFEYKGRDGKLRYYRIEDVLLHVIEEEIHHRGELLCIYWQNNIRPPYTSYMTFKNQA